VQTGLRREVLEQGVSKTAPGVLHPVDTQLFEALHPPRIFKKK
jgi:hypothetical protein